MTRMTGPDCVVMCNLINKYIHTYIHTYIQNKYIHTYMQALLADGVGPEQLTEEQRVAMDTTGLTVVR